MSSAKYTSETRPGIFTPDEESPTMVVEMKSRLSGGRGLRDALAQLAGFLTQFPGKRAILLLVDPRITPLRVLEEWRRLGAALRPEIAERLSIVRFHEGQFIGKPADLSPSDCQLLEELVAGRSAGSTLLPRPDMQSEVLRVLVLQWIQRRGPVTSLWLQETVGCNYRTVAASLERLGPAVRRYSSRQVELKYFPKNEWAKLLATSGSARAPRHYVHRSDQVRSPESLLRRLRALERSDLAVGGVLGARHYHPHLDLVGTPRLDICVHSPEGAVDIDFLHRLDPALELTRRPDAPTRVVLNFLRRKKCLFEEDTEGNLWADPVECLFDLHDVRLEAQALGLVEFLSNRSEGREVSRG